MPSVRLLFTALSCGVAVSAFGCNAVLGLDKLTISSQSSDAGSSGGSGGESGTGGGAGTGGSGGAPIADAAPDAPKGECQTNDECTQRLTTQSVGMAMALTNDAGVVPAICVKPEHKCMALLSEDCQTITGDYHNDDAVVLGSLFSVKGAQAATNLPREQSVMLAVEEINAVGGVPGVTNDVSRPLVLVSCDESTNLSRAGGHLITDLHVPAIVGPNTSQDTIDLSNKLSIAGGTVVMTPTGVASSIADLRDNDLTWLMVPSDVQRAPLMVNQIGALETQLKSERQVATVKLGVIYRNDALGTGTRTSLDALTINGKPISDSVNLNKNVKVSPYDFTQPDQTTTVNDYLKFLPDIIVLAGTAEAITKVMVPLEQKWPQSESDAGRRPFYILIDSVKVPDLITAVTGNDDLRRRVRGTGVTPGAGSAAVNNAFQIDFTARYPGVSAKISGMGPSYDALYGVAYALAATRSQPATGKNIAGGLRMLAGGSTVIQNSGTKALAAFQKLSGGEKITAIGTFGPLEWDSNGAVVGGTLEMWCIDGSGMTPAYQSSGLTFDVKTQKFGGDYTQCGP
jgi:ABC-type branched-subunit amino acid transport system substrate-binding protein